MFRILPESHDGTLAVKASGKLVHADYAALGPELERRIAAHGKLSALFDITEFEGWDLHGAWDDFALGMKHIGDFERIAVVGDAKWQDFAINLADALTSADVRFFQKAKREQAWTWVQGAPSP
jgi:hypothetical protein